MECRTASMELSRFFRISSRSHHGLVFVTELMRAHGTPERTSIRAVAEKIGISDGYLEEIAACLRTSGLIRGARGRSGGYVLARDPATVTMGDIIRVLDGPGGLAPCQ